jgi:hypothetical protein
MNKVPYISSPNDLKYAASTERNSKPILKILQKILPKSGFLLEIAAGSGQHAANFAPYFPEFIWQPSDPDPDSRASITAWIKHVNAKNINIPIDLDVTSFPWPISEADAIFSSNMIHITSWECCLALMAGAGQILKPLGVLVLYGPFLMDEKKTALSNVQFDNSLKKRNPNWGIRNLDKVCVAAKLYGLVCSDILEMPANNLMVILKK